MEGRYPAQRAKATGRPLDAEVVHVWDRRDGKVVRFHQYVDTRQLANVLGASD
jgi:ketosteroid isomerase-like protein